MSPPHVIVIGGGLAGLSAAVALADAGLRISLFEKSPRLGGRAASYVLGSGEHIDNCQHVTLGCCTNLEDFYARLGVGAKIGYYDRLTFGESTGRRAAMKASLLPAPLHLLPGFVAFPFLKWDDKYAIARAMLRIVGSGGQPKLSVPISMLDWLKQQRQTQRAIDRFWRTVLISALNEELSRIDAGYGIGVFWKAFLSNPKGFVVGIPSVALAELYASCTERIEQNGGRVRTRCGVAELQICAGPRIRVRLDDGVEVDGDYCVAALTFDRLLQILPEKLQGEPPFSNLRQLRVSPITSIHLWFDQTVMTEPFLTSTDQTIQWVFNKSKLYRQEASQGGQYLQIVVSASYGLSQRPQQEIVELCRRELAQLIPATGKAKLLRAVVIRENAATFSPEPGCDNWRPHQRTTIRNLLLAGDWIQTAWPATMESAVRSGYQAAEAILAEEGRPARLLQRDLPATGLARWFARA